MVSKREPSTRTAKLRSTTVEAVLTAISTSDFRRWKETKQAARSRAPIVDAQVAKKFAEFWKIVVSCLGVWWFGDVGTGRLGSPSPPNPQATLPTIQLAVPL